MIFFNIFEQFYVIIENKTPFKSRDASIIIYLQCIKDNKYKGPSIILFIRENVDNYRRPLS